MLLLWLCIFVLSVLLLVFGADYFVEKAEKIALGFGISSFIIGVTVVAIGTSLPELITSLFALHEYGVTGERVLMQIPLEGILGSNIANILIVIGLSAIFAKKIKITSNLIESDIPLLCIFTGVFVFFLFRDGVLSRAEGVVCLLLFLVFCGYTVSTRKKHHTFIQKQPKIQTHDFILLVGSALAIGLGGYFSIRAIEQLIPLFGWTDSGILVLVVLALGTSLPEIAVSLQASKKKKFELAIGNVFGSNVFNMFFVGGIASLFFDLPLSTLTSSVGLPFLVLATLGFLFTAQDDHIGYWEGMGLVSVYVVFILALLNVI